MATDQTRGAEEEDRLTQARRLVTL
jgi:hypothetical protein